MNEDGIMKLHRSWKVKTFMKGLQFFQLVANLAEAEGIAFISQECLPVVVNSK